MKHRSINQSKKFSTEESHGKQFVIFKNLKRVQIKNNCQTQVLLKSS